MKQNLNELTVLVAAFFAEYPFVIWLIVLGAAITLAVGARIAKAFVEKRLARVSARTSVQFDDLALLILRSIRSWAIFVWILSALSGMVTMPSAIRSGISFVVIVATLMQLMISGLAALGFWNERFLSRRIENDASSAAVLGLLYVGAQAALVVFLVLFGLANFGIDIRALLAGLGVGGIAVALAAQNILGDLLASLSIVLDKPFVVGDFIVAGEEKGTVEHIGIKTTRVRSLSGEQLVFSNKDLLESRVRNFKRMYQRRATQKFTIGYETTPEKLEVLPNKIAALFTDFKQLRFEYCRLIQYSPAGLDYEIVFFVEDPDNNLYLQLQEQLLIGINRLLREMDIDFARPTQNLVLPEEPRSRLQEPVTEGHA